MRTTDPFMTVEKYQTGCCIYRCNSIKIQQNLIAILAVWNQISGLQKLFKIFQKTAMIYCIQQNL